MSAGLYHGAKYTLWNSAESSSDVITSAPHSALLKTTQPEEEEASCDCPEDIGKCEENKENNIKQRFLPSRIH